MGRKFALIIGNTEYADHGLAQLTAPSKDAEDFARILRDPKLCGFDEVNVLLNQISSSVIETIDEFFDQKKPDDLLVLYFSGHGIRDELGSLYLAFKNTIRTRLRSTAVKAEYIREAMDQSRSKRQVLILDCCNSGAFPQGTKAEVGGAMGIATTFQGYVRYVLTASDATQFAWEGDKVIGETENSLFTHFLVKGLEGEADNDGDGKITVDELYEYIFGQVSKITPKQTPTKSASKQEGDIVLRHITRMEDIRPVSLPDELLEATNDSRTFVREGAVQQLEKFLKGKNLGLVRSAREAIEKIAAEDDSLRVRQAAVQALESYHARQREAQAAIARADEERLEREKAEAQQQVEMRRNVAESKSSRMHWSPFLIAGIVLIGILLLGYAGIRFLRLSAGSPNSGNRSPTATAQKKQVQILSVIGAGTLDAEAVIVKSNGEGELDMTGWHLKDTRGSSYTFPPFTLFKNGAVQVHAKSGPTRQLTSTGESITQSGNRARRCC